MKKRFLLVLALCTFLGTGCQKKDGETNEVPPPPPLGDVAAGFTLTQYIPKGEESEEFYKWKKQYLRYRLHKGTVDFDEPCTAEVGEDITCILEADEHDLYYFGTAFQYNIPPDMCNYIHHRPYVYYGLPAGDGPALVTVDSVNGTVGSDLNSDGDLGDAGELNDSTVCQYDYTRGTPAGPNCCTGSYTKINRTWNGASYDVDSIANDVAWGGKLSSCLDGPPMLLPDWPKNTEGMPLTLIKWVYGFGDSAFHEIYAPISTKAKGPRGGSNVFAASWYDPLDHGGTYPTAAFLYNGRPAMGDEISCRDRDSEVLSRITIYVREWNTQAAFDAMDDSPNDHSLGGLEDPPYADDGLNDHADWGDVGNTYPGLPVP